MTLRSTTLALTLALGCAAFLFQAVAAPTSARAEPDASTKIERPYDVVKRMMLDKFFDELRAAKSQDDGNRAMAKIWHMWMTSGRPGVDGLLRQSHAVMMRGALGLALRLADRVVEMAPTHSEAWNHRATVHYLRGDYGKAVGDIQKALQREPRHFGALAGLGFIYIKLKKWDGALKAFEAATAVNPWLHHRAKVMKMLRLKVSGQAL
ncbi:MAG: tetratricopeptide repeat protein [Pseudomonadota bacterium]